MNPSITFQIWDKDVIGSDDYISAVTMDFASQARDSFENDVSVKILGKQSFNLLGKVSKLFSSSSGKKEEDNGKKENDKKQDSQDAKKDQSKDGEKFDLDLNSVAKDGFVLDF